MIEHGLKTVHEQFVSSSIGRSDAEKLVVISLIICVKFIR